MLTGAPAASRSGPATSPGRLATGGRAPTPRVGGPAAGARVPLVPRIRRRLVLECASRGELLVCLDHQLEAAGNPSLMTTELKATL
jgi:hypothetical protein